MVEELLIKLKINILVKNERSVGDKKNNLFVMFALSYHDEL